MSESDKKSLEKGLASVVVGLVAAAVVVVALEPLLRTFYPTLSADPLLTPEQYLQIAESLPIITSLMVLGLFTVASLTGGLATSLTFGRTRSWPAVITGAVLMIAGTWAVMTVYQPAWFRIAVFLTYPFAYLGHLIVRKSD